MENFKITDEAFRRVSQISERAYLRIVVEGGGCSGFKYRYEFDTKANDDDCLFFSENTSIESSVVVDQVSLGFLKDATLDYKEDLGSAGFEIRNPNATARCGCGNSFSV